MAPLIGGWLVVSLPHDDSLCSRQGAMLAQLDAVSRAHFLHLVIYFKQSHKHATTPNSSARVSNTIYIAIMLRKERAVRWHDNLIQGQPNKAIDQMGHQPVAGSTILTFGMSWCSLSNSSFELYS